MSFSKQVIKHYLAVASIISFITPESCSKTQQWSERGCFNTLLQQDSDRELARDRDRERWRWVLRFISLGFFTLLWLSDLLHWWNLIISEPRTLQRQQHKKRLLQTHTQKTWHSWSYDKICRNIITWHYKYDLQLGKNLVYIICIFYSLYKCV